MIRAENKPMSDAVISYCDVHAVGNMADVRAVNTT
jgi:hypothetical protein